MSKRKRIRFNCRACPSKVRTSRKTLLEVELCEKCFVNSAKANISTSETQVGVLDHLLMEEWWWHKLFYQNVESNGLACLGLGRLEFLSPKQQTDKMRGQFYHRIDEDTVNRYDLLLKSKKHNRLVCVELKRKADRDAIGQLESYYVAVRDRSREKGLEDQYVCLICLEMDSTYYSVLKFHREHGLPLRTLKVHFEDDKFQLKEVEVD